MTGKYSIHFWLLLGFCTYWFIPAISAQETDTDSTKSVEQSRVLTLEELVDLAQENSPNLREAAQAVEASQGRALQAGLYPNPEINSGAGQLGGSASEYFTVLSQEIVTKGKLLLDRAAAFREIDQSELAFLRTRFDLLTDVRQRFYATLAAQQRVEILQNLVKIANRSKESAVSLLKAGEGARTDVLLLEVQLENAQLALQNAETLLIAQKNQLIASIGLPELRLTRIEGDLDEKLPDYEYDLLREGLISENALTQIAQVEVERRQILLNRAQVELFPNITLEAGYLYSVSPPNDQAILQLRLPLPIWNRNQGNIREAQAEVSRAAETLARVQNDLSGRLAEALGGYRVAKQFVERYELKILPKAKLTLEITQQGYNQGEFGFLRLLEAQRTLIQADLGYIDAQERRWSTAAQIAGLLQEESFPQTSESP